jgi:hypothetical protein
VPLPSGYINCNGSGYIFINGSYYQVPSLNDKIISGTTTYSSVGTEYGTQSPTTSSSIKIAKENLPKHTHDFGTLQPKVIGYNNVKYDYIQIALDKAYHPSQSGSSFKNNGKIISSNSFDMNGQGGYGGFQWDLTITGNTGDGALSNTSIPIPVIKGMKVIFLIKYNPGALQGTTGHFTATKIAGASYTYKSITGTNA